jgi:polygalacturonase
MKTSSCLALLALASILGGALRASVFDVKTFGATGDGRTLDTAALQKSIDAAHATGGGTVYFSTGRFLSGTLYLKSNVTLHLSPGAVLLGSPRMADYPVKHLLYAKGAENIAIEGRGTIDGHGDAFFDQDMKPAAVRPSPLLEFWDSRGLRIENITVRNAPAWTIHPKNCDDVKIRGISVLNNLRHINSDGIGIDSSRNVIISDCHIEAGDDCIVLKTTKRGDGPVQPTENVVVTNCVLVSAATALKLGTESHADFRHVLFSNCVIRNSRTGIGLLAKDGGTMEDIRFSNIVMTTAPKWGQGLEWPIVVDVEKRTAESRLSHTRDVAFSDITIYSKGRVMVGGVPESRIEGVSFRNVNFRVGGYEVIKTAKKMRGGAKTVAEGTPDYAPTPAAFIFAFIKGLSLDGIAVTWPDADPANPAPERQAIYGDHLEDATLAGLRVGGSLPGVKPILIENSRGVSP